MDVFVAPYVVPFLYPYIDPGSMVTNLVPKSTNPSSPNDTAVRNCFCPSYIPYVASPVSAAFPASGYAVFNAPIPVPIVADVAIDVPMVANGPVAAFITYGL